jgi:hypothetical protein
MWVLLRVCAACTSRLNLKFELRPSWNNIHDVPHRDRAGHNLTIEIIDVLRLFVVQTKLNSIHVTWEINTVIKHKNDTKS